MVELIGVPFDLCGKWPGSRLGPEALRIAGIIENFSAIGVEVTDRGDLPRQQELTADGGIRNFQSLFDCVRLTRAEVESSLDRGVTPLVMGGEHTVALGGLSAAVNRFNDITLLWIDAHADLNTPKTSPSGNLHGMPVAALWGLPSGLGGTKDKEWRRLVEMLGPNTLAPERTSWFGVRELDLGERDLINGASDSLAIAMDTIDRIGVAAAVERFDSWITASGSQHLWISFDVDALDPIFAPGTGTAVRGGLTYREAHLVAEMLRELLDRPSCPYKLVGLDLVEANPIRDTTNITSILTAEWAASLFGKTILPKR